MFPARYALYAQDGILDPAAIADAYWMLHCQPRTDTKPDRVGWGELDPIG